MVDKEDLLWQLRLNNEQLSNDEFNTIETQQTLTTLGLVILEFVLNFFDIFPYLKSLR